MLYFFNIPIVYGNIHSLLLIIGWYGVIMVPVSNSTKSVLLLQINSGKSESHLISGSIITLILLIKFEKSLSDTLCLFFWISSIIIVSLWNYFSSGDKYTP